MIDASHDNSGKDPARQIVAAGEIGEQIAAGNEAIVGVMLESFLVEGSQSSDGDGQLDLRPVDHRRLHGLGGHASRSLDGLAAAVRARREPMKVAVLGVGLIGGSIGLAARARLEDAEVVGFDRDTGDRWTGRSSSARSTAPPTRRRAPATGADAGLLRAPVGGACRAGRRGARGRGRGRRRHRRRLDQARARRRARRRRALHRRPPAGGRRDRRRRATPAPTSSTAPAGT